MRSQYAFNPIVRHRAISVNQCNYGSPGEGQSRISGAARIVAALEPQQPDLRKVFSDHCRSIVIGAVCHDDFKWLHSLLCEQGREALPNGGFAVERSDQHGECR